MQRNPLRAGVALLALTAVASVAPGTTAPAQEAAPPRPSLNLYGVTGLIDMPSAEAQPDAQVSASYSQFGNTSRRNFTFQLLPRVSGTLRYATISDWGNSDDPGYNLFDRSLDLQFQLLKEQGLAAFGGARLPRRAGHRRLFGGVPGRDQDGGARLHGHRRHRLGPARQRGRGEEPVLLGRGQLLRAQDRLRRGRHADLRRDVPWREDGLLRRRRVADADRQADAEGRGLVGRLHPRAAGARIRLRAQVADQRRRRVPAAAGHHAGRLLHVRLDRGLQRGGVGQPVQAADPAEPRAPGRCRSTRARPTPTAAAPG